MTSVINAAHRHGTRVVLTVSVFAWTTSQASVQQRAPRQLRRAAQPRAAGRRGGPRPRARTASTSTSSRSRSGYGDEFVALLRTIRSEFNKVRSGYQITYDTTAYIGNYPLEASVGKRAADAIFVMGYDYRIGSSSTAGLDRPLSRPGVRPRRHRPRLQGRVSPARG